MPSPFPVTPLTPVSTAAQANLVLVAQGIEAIRRLGADHYTVPVAGCFNSAAGGHMRHALDHYQALLGVLAGGDFDYENRERDTAIETDPAAAIEAWRMVEAGLQRLAGGAEPDRALHLASETSAGGVLPTSLARELEFLINHTVHHFALIAVIAHAHGVALPAGFGLAPSTLKYRQTRSPACAR